jgi:two-component system cell cycle response regulator
MTDELRTRALARGVRLRRPVGGAVAETGQNARVLLVDDRQSSFERLAAALGSIIRSRSSPTPPALIKAAEEGFELVLVSLDLQGFEGCGFCSQLRTLERTRNVRSS